MLRIITLAALTIWMQTACNTGDLQATGQADDKDEASGSTGSTPPPADEPVEITGSYLTCARTEDPSSSESDARIGCAVKNQDDSKADIDGYTQTWKVTDQHGAEIKHEEEADASGLWHRVLVVSEQVLTEATAELTIAKDGVTAKTYTMALAPIFDADQLSQFDLGSLRGAAFNRAAGNYVVLAKVAPNSRDFCNNSGARIGVELPIREYAGKILPVIGNVIGAVWQWAENEETIKTQQAAAGEYILGQSHCAMSLPSKGLFPDQRMEAKHVLSGPVTQVDGQQVGQCHLLLVRKTHETNDKAHLIILPNAQAFPGSGINLSVKQLDQLMSKFACH